MDIDRDDMYSSTIREPKKYLSNHANENVTNANRRFEKMERAIARSLI